MVNAEFERKGFETRIDHRSFEAQGIEQIPTVHEGPLVQKMEKRGIRTQKGDLNRWIKATNRLIVRIKKKLKSLVEWITAKRITPGFSMYPNNFLVGYDPTSHLSIFLSLLQNRELSHAFFGSFALQVFSPAFGLCPIR